MTSEQTAIYAQGARCGHIEGKERAGAYTNGEEILLAREAGEVHEPMYGVTGAALFAAGYAYGYVRAAAGEALPIDLLDAPLPHRGKMNDVVNLDGMTESELAEFERANRGVRGQALVCRVLYAREKREAMRHRLAGRIDRAMHHERLCDSLYKALPESLRW